MAWPMFVLDVVIVLYLAWSVGRLRAGMQQDRDAILAALRPLQESNERITQLTSRTLELVRDLHR